MSARATIDAALAECDADAILTPGNFHANVGVAAGYPTVIQPLGHTDGGKHPFGLGFLGPAYSEAQLLAYAFAFEQDAHAHSAEPRSTRFSCRRPVRSRATVPDRVARVMGSAAETGSADRAGDIAARLAELLAAPVESVSRLSGGASRDTWAFELADGSERRPLILQADRLSDSDVPGRGGRPAQAPLLRAAADAGVPVAPVVASGEGDPVLGPSWVVVERVEGTADPGAILAGAGVPDADALLDNLAAALAAVHRMRVDEGAVPVVDDPLAALRSLHDEVGEPHPVFEFAFRELEATPPPPSPRSFVHGDFRMGNLLVGPQGVTAVLDWELSHIADPLADVGWLCARAWRFGRPDRPAAGLGSREALAAAYERHTGGAVDHAALRWWEIFGNLRWGVFCVVQAFTHLSGAVRSLEHAVIGRRACEVEWDLLELLDPGRRAEGMLPGAREADAAAPPRLHDRPTARELIDAVRRELGDDVLPQLEGRRAFQVRVALRALGMVDRELRHAPAHAALHAAALQATGAGDDAELAASIRAGAFDDRRDELLAALWATVRAKLEASNPRHMEFSETAEENLS